MKDDVILPAPKPVDENIVTVPRLDPERPILRDIAEIPRIVVKADGFVCMLVPVNQVNMGVEAVEKSG